MFSDFFFNNQNSLGVWIQTLYDGALSLELVNVVQKDWIAAFKVKFTMYEGRKMLRK